MRTQYQSPHCFSSKAQVPHHYSLFEQRIFYQTEYDPLRSLALLHLPMFQLRTRQRVLLLVQLSQALELPGGSQTPCSSRLSNSLGPVGLGTNLRQHQGIFFVIVRGL